MSVQAPQAQSTMNKKEMLKMFFPIVLISIILPLIDIVTDLRLIIQLYSSVIYIGIGETHYKFATLLMGE